MTTQLTITDSIVKGDLAEDIATQYNITEAEAKELITTIFKALEDENIDETEFQLLCNSIDTQYSQ